MRKARSLESGPAGKAGLLARNVDEYLATVPEPARSTLSKIRAAIVAVLPPEAIETISYRIPAYKYKGLLVGFAAFTTHCTFATVSPPVIEAFKDELQGYETADSIVRFPHDQPLPASLVKKIVKARIVENKTGRKS
jgi:uncharacterized protein YdhG (YjbR/CyaY superfamily)